MRVALGSDMTGELPEAIARWLATRGHEVLALRRTECGKRRGLALGWTGGRSAVAGGAADYGVLCCWTGTGVSIAANKVSGARAALCADAATAAGAREWNDANVLCLSLRATSVPVAEEMLDAWFASSPTTDPSYRAMIESVRPL